MAEANNSIGSTQGNSEVSFTISSANFTSSLGASSTTTTNNEFTNLFLTITPVAQGNVVTLDYGGIRVVGSASYQAVEG